MKPRNKDSMTQPHLCRIDFESRTNTIFKRLLPQRNFPVHPLVTLIFEIYMAACRRVIDPDPVSTPKYAVRRKSQSNQVAWKYLSDFERKPDSERTLPFNFEDDAVNSLDTWPRRRLKEGGKHRGADIAEKNDLLWVARSSAIQPTTYFRKTGRLAYNLSKGDDILAYEKGALDKI